MNKDKSFALPLDSLASSGVGVSVSPAAGLGISLDLTGKIPLSTLPFNAIAFGASAFSFSASSDAGTITFSNIFSLRNSQTSGGYYTPTTVLATGGSISGHQMLVTVTSLTTGGATFSGKIADGTSVTGSVPFYYLMIA